MFVWIFLNEHKEQARTHEHWAPEPQLSVVPFCLLAKEARTKQGECRALVVKGQKVTYVLVGLFY
jgi:hypothetical protein